MAEAPADTDAGGLTGMDWFVIVAAVLCLALTLGLLVRGRTDPPGEQPA